MQAFKCKICGGSLNVISGQKVVECEYCGVKQTVSVFKEPNIQEIYDRAGGYLKNNEFDKAENLFVQLLIDDKENSDAYWNVLMCRYGVNYVKDPASGKYIPTCNRTLYTPIFSDENYQKALEYADDEQKAIYEENAKTIDEIQKGIIAVSKHEKPFDIFISYKETDANGNRTKDSIVAAELYEKLTAEGYKVFFSRITLEDKVGKEFEPYIYSALYSSKVMLTVCSSKENIEAVWVRNEWSRFISLQQKNADKTLIPLYFDMDKSDLPDEFVLLPSNDIKKDGFEADLIRSIKKLIPLPVMLAQKRKKQKKVLTIAACVAVLVAIPLAIFSYLKITENNRFQAKYDAAYEMYNNGEYAQSTWAFEELGDYKDANDMQEKAELSWRKSLASVVSADFHWYSSGTEVYYYINQNGEVYTTTGQKIDFNKEIAQHGKIISIAAGTDNVLHEDGTVTGTDAEKGIDNNPEWNNIIKVSRPFFDAVFALRADGKMVCSDIVSQTEMMEKHGSDSDEWVKEILEWEDIVDFSCFSNSPDEGCVGTGAIVGVKSDGTLCFVCNPESEYNGVDAEYLKEAIPQLNEIGNIKKVMFCDAYYCYDSNNCLLALTKDNKVYAYGINTDPYEQSDKETLTLYEIKAQNVCDLVSYEHYITSDNEVYCTDEEKPLGQEIIKTELSQNNNLAYAISKTGTTYEVEIIYDYIESDGYTTKTEGGLKKTGFKTVIYDEWIARLK
ncbi:MAG: toll/interleukin-1 receptor domain-containing protein [Clostridia bacterium]|nr:toll/interleukin-1 receptor domain-containing protein [Clostridia bacterium]